MDRPDFWNRKLKDARPFGLIDRDFVPRNMARIRSQTRANLESEFLSTRPILAYIAVAAGICNFYALPHKRQYKRKYQYH